MSLRFCAKYLTLSEKMNEVLSLLYHTFPKRVMYPYNSVAISVDQDDSAEEQLRQSLAEMSVYTKFSHSQGKVDVVLEDSESRGTAMAREVLSRYSDERAVFV